MKARENRVPIMMSEAELEEVDTFRFANRIMTRSGAIRALARLGLKYATIASECTAEIDRAKRPKRKPNHQRKEHHEHRNGSR